MNPDFTDFIDNLAEIDYAREEAEANAAIARRLPLSLGDVSPGEGFTRMEMKVNWRGNTEGAHTGGPFTDGTEVWKPLDALSFGGCKFRVPTREADILQELFEVDPKLFPKNWRVEERNGRRFLVRPIMYVAGEEWDFNCIDIDAIRRLEQMIETINALGWTINDPLNVAFDQDYNVHILDFSCAAKYNMGDDERNRLYDWIKNATPQHSNFVKLREAGRHVVSSAKWQLDERNVRDWEGEPRRYVYACWSRPLSTLWCRIPNSEFVHNEIQHDPHITHSWCVVPGLLDAETVYRYELTLAWKPFDGVAKNDDPSTWATPTRNAVSVHYQVVDDYGVREVR